MRRENFYVLLALLWGSHVAWGATLVPPAIRHGVPSLCTDVAVGFDGDWWSDCVGTLLQLRGSEDPGRARLADRELRAIKDPAARPAIEREIVNADVMGRLALMASLERIATAASLPMLKTMLLDDPDVPLRGRAYALIERVTGMGPAPLVLEALESKSAERRERAAYTAAEVQLDRATPLLIQIVQSDPSPAVRIAAVEAFQQVGGDGAEDAVAEALRRDSNGSVRITAARVLGAIGVSEAMPKLSRVADTDPDANVREAALNSLEILRRSTAAR